MTSKAFDNATDANRQQGGRRNLIINGAMQVAQRGTSAVSVGNPTYLLDRWRGSKSGDGAFTMEQSTDAPDDFGYSLKIVVTTADSSVAASEFYSLQQRIEGYNTQQLNFGSSAAKTVTLSFWVKSSVTGTFGGACANSAYNRSYPFTYTISSANTWEKKTVTLTGDTTGTWLTGNSLGLQLLFDLGSGTDNTGTAGAWVGAGNIGADGSTKLIETLNSTFYITGVQLEVGTVATPFEHRSYGEELALCQRYYEKSFNQANAPSGGSSAPDRTTGVVFASNNYGFQVNFSVAKRTAPTMVYYRGNNAGSVNSGTVNRYTGSVWVEENIGGGGRQTDTYASQDVVSSGLSVGDAYILQLGFTADAEL